MIRITENFTLRRVAGQLAVSMGPFTETLSPEQTKDAAEAFGIMAALLTPLEAYGEEEELEEAA